MLPAERTTDDRAGRLQSSDAELQARIAALESLTAAQGLRIAGLAEEVRILQKDVPLTVSVLQYNILASYLGQNTQPWFLYGADMDKQLRQQVLEKYYERDGDGGFKNSGWPAYVEGLLTQSQIDAVNHLDRHFDWETRKVRLLKDIASKDCDIMSLVELDAYDYFADGLSSHWDSIFAKRPRQCSKDGCGIFWRRSKFELVERISVEFTDSVQADGREMKDRICLMALLRHKSTGTTLVVISTHLARDPDDEKKTLIRARQLSQLMQSLTDFTLKFDATEAPVILMGDLNAKHFGEIRGIARLSWQTRGDAAHPFLWSATDVPTGPTSVTRCRRSRIDVVQYLSSQLEVLSIAPLPRLEENEVIPNERHPSDHLPVCVHFRVKDTSQRSKECARSWLGCVAGNRRVTPLTEAQLHAAFEFFDRDCSGSIHHIDFEEACIDLQVNLDQDLQDLLLSCFPNQQIDYDFFARAYETRIEQGRMSSTGDLEAAIRFLAGGEKKMTVEHMKWSLQRLAPVDFSDEEFDDMMRSVHVDSNDHVDVRSFCNVLGRTSFSNRRRKLHKEERRNTKTRRESKTAVLKFELESSLKSFDSHAYGMKQRWTDCWGMNGNGAWDLCQPEVSSMELPLSEGLGEYIIPGVVPSVSGDASFRQ